nr:DUF4062 domain-containing protein [Stenotrophomonas geniculata]
MNSNKKLQVFVSSTYLDLKLERQAAVEAILKAGHIPAGMELFSAGSESQLETIRRWIDDSDVYMLILGGRYGSVDPQTSLSYTELEYDYALSQGKPIFSVVIESQALENKIRLEGSAALEADYPKELKFFREKVLSKISSFFSDEKDIKLAVHETLADYSKRLDFTGWISGREAVDTKPLLEELARLREDKEKLQARLDSMIHQAPKQASGAAKKWPDEDMREIVEMLNEIEVSTRVFLKEEDAEPLSYPVMRIVSVLRDKLVTGVTNKMGSSKVDNFLYYNVLPKLEIYDLAGLEKVAGMQWQRYRLTAKGKALIAFFDKDASRKVSKSAAAEGGQGEAVKAVDMVSETPRKAGKSKANKGE